MDMSAVVPPQGVILYRVKAPHIIYRHADRVFCDLSPNRESPDVGGAKTDHRLVSCAWACMRLAIIAFLLGR